MIRGDDIAYNLYSFLYEDHEPKVLITSGEVYSNKDLFERLMSYDNEQEALSEMNAELWLQNLGESYLSDYFE